MFVLSIWFILIFLLAADAITKESVGEKNLAQSLFLVWNTAVMEKKTHRNVTWKH